MAKATKYYLCLHGGRSVGPHKLDSLREWVELGFISLDCQVRREDEKFWMSVAQIPSFHDFPLRLRERIDRSRRKPRDCWWFDPPTNKQLKKLRYFDVQFDSSGLTKGRASELIDAFAKIDPTREEQYQSRPASAAQAKEIRSLGGNPASLTHSDAKELIDELRAERDEQEWECAFTFSLLEHRFNDRDAREIGHYKKLTKAQLKQLLDYFETHVPDWEDRNRFDLCEIVPHLFPEQAKPPRRRTKSSGCLTLLIASASSAILYIILTRST